jgi:Asp-tRNA(Asn)/Glu-tRNA(Gln) amidotransferase A subunit family amidase
VADLELALRLLSNWRDDPSADLAAPPAHLLNSADVNIHSLRIGFYLDDGCIRTAPAIRRAVREATAVLANCGAEISEFRPPDVFEAWRLFFALFYADGVHFLKKSLSGSAIQWRIIREIVWFSRLPTILRPPLGQLMAWVGQPWMARPLRWVRKRAASTKEYFELLEGVDHFRTQFAEAIDALQLDAIVCPPSPVPAFVHGLDYTSLTANYTIPYNLLGMPAGVAAAQENHAHVEAVAGAEGGRATRAVARTVPPSV